MNRRAFRRRHSALLRAAALALALLAAGCTGDDSAGSSPSSASSSPLFFDVAARVGLDFVHYSGATGDFHIPEIMGPGCVLFDYDGDGDLDVYALQGALLDRRKSVRDSVFPPRDATPRNALFQNGLVGPDGRPGELRFADVTAAAGVGDAGFGMGAAVGDYDNDGDLDLYVTNFGPNVLFENQGDGTFIDATARAGVGDAGFSASATFLDYDEDGRLDLYVTNYVEFSVASRRECTRLGGQLDYCGPLSYEPACDRLYHNRGDGTFADVSVAAGIHRKCGNGLGVVGADLDGDGWVDIFVANDATPNQLWINRRDGTFEDRALIAGVAVNAEGRSEAGMGVAAQDLDGDGDLDLVLTHEEGETNTCYVNLGGGLFEDATARLGLSEPSLSVTGFGVAACDYDGDTRLDLFIANGAVRKLPSLLGGEHPYHQPDQLFRSDGERFTETTARGDLDQSLPATGRGVAAGDVDNDGDIDLLVANNSGRLRLLLCRGAPAGGWVLFLLEGRRSNRDAYGSEVVVELDDGAALLRRVGTDGSYLSASDRRVHFAFGGRRRVERVVVSWPAGGRELWTGIQLNALTTLREGEGRPAAD